MLASGNNGRRAPSRMHRTALGRIIPAYITPDRFQYNVTRHNRRRYGQYFRCNGRFETLVKAKFTFGRKACTGLYRRFCGMGRLVVNDEYIRARIKIFTADIEVEKYLYGKEQNIQQGDGRLILPMDISVTGIHVRMTKCNNLPPTPQWFFTFC